MAGETYSAVRDTRVGSRRREPIPADVDAASREIIGAAIEVHRTLGPGMLEKINQRALAHELALQGMSVRLEVPVSVTYKDVVIDGQRLDMVVDPGVVVEVKAVERVVPAHEAQVISYLRSTGYRVGLLLNFNEVLLKKDASLRSHRRPVFMPILRRKSCVYVEKLLQFSPSRTSEGGVKKGINRIVC